MPVEDLSKFHVVLDTNQGEMEVEFWPEHAPNHVRNFLDLAYSGFYDKKSFHRVIPGFMIQGGCPQGTGMGDGPRRLKAEFNARKHVKGVLSMARSSNPDSASCQFFVMHAASPHLDGQYSAFGKLVRGEQTLDKIAGTRTGGNDKPVQPQTINKATVVRAEAQKS
ncbi:MAG: peptidylprolyl isomerase [Planctomycetes bacterium]|nr:peptidylprolyl isomerase [Planctomycetota bacterium]